VVNRRASMAEPPDGYMTDWAEWSRQAVSTMQARNRAWTSRFELERAPYRWDLDTAELVFQRALDLVRAFGELHDLPLLTTPEWPGGRAEGLEMLAIAGRIQDASGGFVDADGDLTLFFTLTDFRVVPR
jgi:hypothetical protein